MVSAQIGFAKALWRVFLTMVASYLQFRRWICQATFCNGISVTFDLRQRASGPALAAQARASNSRPTRSSWRTWPQLKLRRKVPRVDGALTVQPMAPAVRPVRNTSASSMQSPPASADATSVSTLSPGWARPGASPRSRCRSTSCGRPRCRPSVARRIRPALLTRRWSSKGNSSESRGNEQLTAGGERI